MLLERNAKFASHAADTFSEKAHKKKLKVVCEDEKVKEIEKGNKTPREKNTK